jgi:hypothetical protein
MAEEAATKQIQGIKLHPDHKDRDPSLKITE